MWHLSISIYYFIDFRPSGENEMCNFYMMYWVENTEPLQQQYCFSMGPPFYYWREKFENIPETELMKYRRNDINDEWSHLQIIYIIPIVLLFNSCFSQSNIHAISRSIFSSNSYTYTFLSIAFHCTLVILKE